MTNVVNPQPGLDNILPYKAGRPIEEIQREYGLKDVIKLASNENPLGPSPKAVKAMQDTLLSTNFYPDAVSYQLRQALAKFLNVSFEQVVVGSGADNLILQLCMAYLDENCEVIASQSSFPVYDIYSKTMRATMVKTPLKDYGLDLTAMANAITDKTKIIFVCNPNNPTGTIVSQAEVDEFMKKVPDTCIVVFDEAYFEYVDAPDYPDSMPYIHQGRKNVLILRTFSKIYGLSGIRLGYGIGDPELLAPLYKVKEPFAVNLLAQVAGIAALEDVEFVDSAKAINSQGRTYFYEQFERLGLFYLKTYGNFILVEFGPDALKIVDYLMTQGIILRPCAAYNLSTFARVSIGTPEQNQRLISVLEKVFEKAKA
jgi:histidinol-phosphate aminotransferase